MSQREWEHQRFFLVVYARVGVMWLAAIKSFLSLPCEGSGSKQEGYSLVTSPPPGENITPPPRENITKIIRPEYFHVIFGGDYGKIM